MILELKTSGSGKKGYEREDYVVSIRLFRVGRRVAITMSSTAVSSKGVKSRKGETVESVSRRVTLMDCYFYLALWIVY